MTAAHATVLEFDHHFATAMQRIQRHREMTSYCDAFVSAGGQTFSAHKVILAGSSEYFNRLFSTGTSGIHDGRVTLEDVTVSALHQVLQFIYTARVSIAVDNVADLLRVTQLLEVVDLLNLIVDFLLSNLERSNCLYLRELSIDYTLDMVREAADQLILNDFEAISQQSGFCKLVESDLTRILESDNLMIRSEEVAFKALVKWIKERPDARKHKFPRLFYLLRLQLVPLDYLCDKVRKENLVQDNPICVKMVTDVMDFHLRPAWYEFEIQKPRKANDFNPNAIVICGKDDLSFYNYRSRSWATTPTQGKVLPSCAVASQYHSIVFCGGYDEEQVATSKVIAFDGSRWTDLPPMQSQRAGAMAVYVRGKLLVFGGEQQRRNRNIDAVYSHTVEWYSERDQIWLTAGQLRTPRCHAVAVAHQETVYLLGGYVHNYFSSTSAASKSVEAFKTIESTWRSCSQMTHERARFGAATCRSNIYVFGGYADDDTMLDSSEFMNVVDGTWTTITTQIPVSLGNTFACCIGDTVYIAGSNTLLTYNTSVMRYETLEPPLSGPTCGRVVPIVFMRRWR